MAWSLDQARDLFFGAGSGTTSLNALHAKTGVIDPHQGVPRYARSSKGGMHKIPSSGTIDLDALYQNYVQFDQYAIAVGETRNTYNITSGYVLPNAVAYGAWGGSGSTDGAWRKFTWNGYTVRVSGYWSGGTKDKYGNWTKSATFKYFRVDISHAKTCYGIVNRYDYTSLGYSDHRGLTADTNYTPSSSSGNKNLTIVCKNKATTW